jgi:flagellar protein FliT
MDGDQILVLYEAIARLTGQMLAAARNGDWEQLVSIGQDCSAQTARLRKIEDGLPRDAAHLRRKTELIHGALDDDARIRELVNPWLTQLAALIGNTRHQQQLHHAYRAGE